MVQIGYKLHQRWPPITRANVTAVRRLTRHVVGVSRSATETLTVVWSEVMFDVIMHTTSLSFQNYIRFFLGTALFLEGVSQTLVCGVDSQQLSLSTAPQRHSIWCGPRLSHATLFRFLNNIRKQSTRYLDIPQHRSPRTVYRLSIFVLAVNSPSNKLIQ